MGDCRAWCCLAVIGASGVASMARADAPPVVYVFDAGPSASERVLMASLQGIVARTTPEVFLGDSLWLHELQQKFPETHVVHSRDPAFFLLRYHTLLTGYVLCDDASRNVGTSVAGATGGVQVDAVTEHYAIAAGLPLLADVRGRSTEWAYRTYAGAFSTEYLFHQSPSIANHLRDLCVYHAGFMFYEDPAWPTYYKWQGAHSLVFGWAPSESDFFHRASINCMMGVAADWLANASVLSQWSVPLERQRTHASGCEPTEPGVHYAAFVMSDGDNVQWLNSTFFGKEWWGSPVRGTFTMNWDMSPTFARLNPIGFNYYYRTASTGEHRDQFVTASGPGVMYPSEYPDIYGFAAANGAAMALADQRVVSILDNSVDTEKLRVVAADPHVMGMMLKVGDAYRGAHGKVWWFDGKPCIAVRYSLWDGYDTPDSLVRDLNGAPRDPVHSQASYSIVNVHPWSKGPAGDPMSNVRSVVDRLDAHVRVVTLEELIVHLRANFGATTCGGCRADRNLDGVVDSRDLFDFLSCFFDPGACAGEGADFNADGAVTAQDLSDFLAAFSAGCG